MCSQYLGENNELDFIQKMIENEEKINVFKKKYKKVYVPTLECNTTLSINIIKSIFDEKYGKNIFHHIKKIDGKTLIFLNIDSNYDPTQPIYKLIQNILIAQENEELLYLRHKQFSLNLKFSDSIDIFHKSMNYYRFTPIKLRKSNILI